MVSEQAVVVGGTADDDEQLRRAHLHLQIYSGLPNYRNSWLRQGFDETDFVPAGSERLARGIVGMGTVEHAAATLTAHLDAGADHVLVQVLGDGNPAWDPRPAFRELAAVRSWLPALIVSRRRSALEPGAQGVDVAGVGLVHLVVEQRCAAEGVLALPDRADAHRAAVEDVDPAVIADPLPPVLLLGQPATVCRSSVAVIMV